MPKGFYVRTKKYREDMSKTMLEAMNRPEIIEKQRQGALKRWARERALKVIEEEPKKDEALVIAKDFINNEMPDKDHARVIMKELESANNKEETVKEEDNFDSFSTEDLKRMADDLEGQFSLAGLCDICRQVFQLSLHVERTQGEKAKYITMLRELGKRKGKLEEARRKRRGN